MSGIIITTIATIILNHSTPSLTLPSGGSEQSRKISSIENVSPVKENSLTEINSELKPVTVSSFEKINSTWNISVGQKKSSSGKTHAVVTTEKKNSETEKNNSEQKNIFPEVVTINNSTAENKSTEISSVNPNAENHKSVSENSKDKSGENYSVEKNSSEINNPADEN